MSRSIAGKIKINSFADLIGGDDTVITEVPVSDLYAFHDHPFRVIEDEKMDETVESIRKYGVLVPGIVRPRPEGGYEIVAGHRRKKACELAGITTMPVVIKNYSDDEAVLAMVDTNIQREDILPGEKAKAYRMKFDVLKHQGARGGSTVEEIGKEAGESGKTVQRYIRLSHLTKGLLTFVDEKKLSIRSGVKISYLKDKEQMWVEDIIRETGVLISPSQAEQLLALSEIGKLTKEKISGLVTGQKPKQKKVIFHRDRLSKYFSENVTEEEIEETIIRLLDEWKEKGGW